MNRVDRIVGLALVGVMGAAAAQQPAPSASKVSAESSGSVPAPAPAPAPAPVPKATAQSEAGEPRANTAPAGTGSSPPVAAGRTPVSSRAVPPGSKKTADAADRLDLSTATVTGDREQPKVMYIVPWKRAEMGDLAGKPMNSLVDEILAPVDRDVFKREVVYYKAVQTDASQNGAQAAPQGEK